ncbi:MAG: DMT family transporter [Porphyromonas sp.]|nr:DMT family transporter [Porphyromonas sp.]
MIKEGTLTKERILGHIAILSANVLFGINLPSMKLVLDPTAGVAWQVAAAARFLGPTILFWLVGLFLPGEPIAKGDHLKLFLAGLFAVGINQSFTAIGVSYTTPFNTSLVTTVGPILTLILSAIFLKEPITTKKSIGVAVGLAGVVWLLMMAITPEATAEELQHQNHFLGLLLNLGSSLTYSTYLTLFKPLVDKYTPVTLMKWLFLSSTIVFLPIYWSDIAATDFTRYDSRFYGSLFYIVVLGSFLPFLLIPVAQKKLRPTVISMYAYTQPFVTAVISIFLGLDRWNWWRVPAIFLIFLGVFIVTQSKSRADIERGEEPHPDQPPK